MQEKTVSVTKSVTVRYPDAINDCSYCFVRRSNVWFCQVTSEQGMKEYAVAGNVTGAEATALASVAGKFLAKYQADVDAGAM